MKYYLKYLLIAVLILNGCGKSNAKKNSLLDKSALNSINALISNTIPSTEGLISYTNKSEYIYEKYENFNFSKIFLNQEMSEVQFFFNSFVNDHSNNIIYKNKMTGEGYCKLALTEKKPFILVDENTGNAISPDKYHGYKLYEVIVISCFWKWYDDSSNKYQEENDLKKGEKFYTLYKIEDNSLFQISADLENESANKYKILLDDISIVKYEKYFVH